MPEGRHSPDERLVLLAKDGNLDAFNSLVDRYQGAVYGLCRRLLGNREAAEDAAQEAFLSAYRGLGRFAGGSFRSWLLRIAANECKDELRRRKRKDAATSLDAINDRLDAPVELADPNADTTAPLQAAELGEAVERLLLRLPFEQRQAVLLVDVYELHYDEVARIAGASVGTIKSRIHRGRERLRTLILESGELSLVPARQER
jgi:RNA polymerase sigma-70 factor (ECF subfamily)